MSDILTSVKISKSRAIHIGSLSKSTIEELGAEHLGFEGYFVFETDDSPASQGIAILGKATDLESALHMAELVAGVRTRRRRRAA